MRSDVVPTDSFVLVNVSSPESWDPICPLGTVWGRAEAARECLPAANATPRTRTCATQGYGPQRAEPSLDKWGPDIGALMGQLALPGAHRDAGHGARRLLTCLALKCSRQDMAFSYFFVKLRCKIICLSDADEYPSASSRSPCSCPQ